jgi:DNA-binding PadR family transcriptional regulator
LSSDADDFLPLTPPAFYVLAALAEGEAHGYALMQRVAGHSGGAVQLSTGTLYGLLSRLVEEGLIRDAACRDARDARRRCYRLTRLGIEVARAEAARLERAVELARAQLLLRPRRP